MSRLNHSLSARCSGVKRNHGRIAQGGPYARGIIPAETLVQNGTAGDNDTAGGTLNQQVLGFLVG